MTTRRHYDMERKRLTRKKKTENILFFKVPALVQILILRMKGRDLILASGIPWKLSEQISQVFAFKKNRER